MLKREIKSEEPERERDSEVSDVNTAEKTKRERSLVRDLFNNEIDGWSTAASPTVEIVIKRDKENFKNRAKDVETRFQRDQGRQNQHKAFVELHESEGNVIQRMTGRENSADRGAAETIIGGIKAELQAQIGAIEREKFKSHEKRIAYVIHHWKN